MGSKWPYSGSYEGCCFAHLFKTQHLRVISISLSYQGLT